MSTRPSFIGYYYILKGLAEIVQFSNHFFRIMPFVKGMIFYSIIIYVVNLFVGKDVANMFDVSNIWHMIVVALRVVSTAFELFISYNIVIGINDIEISESQHLNAKPLYSAWKSVVVFKVLSFLLLFIQALVHVNLMLFFVLAYPAALIYYLYAFNKTRGLFRERCPTLQK